LRVSLFRSCKAFVEVWRARLSKMAEFEVTAEKDTYLPGDVVNVSVRVTGKEELDIEEGRVALVCTNLYVYEYSTTDSESDQVYRIQGVAEEAEAAGERILEDHPAGEPYRARAGPRGAHHGSPERERRDHERRVEGSSNPPRP
ncbi:MAG TPA: hypothetical protein VF068_03335, partial [Rubrobacter sp.]